MTEQKSRHLHVFINWIFFLTIALAILFSFYKYYHLRDFDYYVEASCNPATELCFFRDCEEDPDSCPPNQLSYYKSYYIKAYDFPKCDNGDCGQVCDEGKAVCEKIDCDTEAGDECVMNEQEEIILNNDTDFTEDNTKEAE